MSTRAEDLRAQADAIEAEDALAEAMNAALEAFRSDPSPVNETAYKTAKQALADSRQLARASRPGLTVTAEVNEVEE